MSKFRKRNMMGFFKNVYLYRGFKKVVQYKSKFPNKYI